VIHVQCFEWGHVNLSLKCQGTSKNGKPLPKTLNSGKIRQAFAKYTYMIISPPLRDIQAEVLVLLFIIVPFQRQLLIGLYGFVYLWGFFFC